MKTIEPEHIMHPIPPIYDENAEILILGSFPSVKSREEAFFYGHPQNRFWKVLAVLLGEAVPETVDEKRTLLISHHVALWDVIGQCEIVGSSDSSIRNAIPNDLTTIIKNSKVHSVFCNGATAWQYYHKYQEPVLGIPAIKLPSTSPANAAYSLPGLLKDWKVICRALKILSPGIGEVLLDWYDYNARILPWRSDPTPYHVWLSEIMLQQTRVEAVKKYYDRWIDIFPDIADLAGANEETVFKLWEGLGYYSRAANILKTARMLMEKYDGRLPEDREALRSLPGIGEYTAGAIASIAYGLPEAAIDGNVMRIVSRMICLPDEIQTTKAKKVITREIRKIMPKDRPGDFNQALMDLGASVCLPNGDPLCDRCPWESECLARRNGCETKYPKKEKKKPRKVEHIAVFLIETDDGIVLHKRKDKGLLARMWEFPNGEGIRTAEDAKLWLEKRGVANGPGDEDDFALIPAGTHKHIFTHVEWHMKGYRLHLPKLPEDLCKKQEWILVQKEDLENVYAIPSAFEPFKETMKQKNNSR